jgi:hypothetical protein
MIQIGSAKNYKTKIIFLLWIARNHNTISLIILIMNHQMMMEIMKRGLFMIKKIRIAQFLEQYSLKEELITLLTLNIKALILTNFNKIL